MKCSGKLKVYRIYNMDMNRRGAPFVRCEGHIKGQRIPERCVLQEIPMVCEAKEAEEPKAAATKFQQTNRRR